MKKLKTILRKGGKEVNTTNYIVKSIGFDFKTHKSFGIQYENIDLLKNSLFKGCEDEWEIETQFEDFWNRLNRIESDWNNRRNSIVKVLEVYPIQEFSWKFPVEYGRLKRNQNRIYPVEVKSDELTVEGKKPISNVVRFFNILKNYWLFNLIPIKN